MKNYIYILPVFDAGSRLKHFLFGSNIGSTAFSYFIKIYHGSSPNKLRYEKCFVTIRTSLSNVLGRLIRFKSTPNSAITKFFCSVNQLWNMYLCKFLYYFYVYKGLEDTKGVIRNTIWWYPIIGINPSKYVEVVHERSKVRVVRWTPSCEAGCVP